MIRTLFVALTIVASATSTVGAGDALITLAPGESTLVPGSDLTLGFDKVSGDSRCPSSVVCVWEGCADIDLWVEDPQANRTAFRLHTSPVEGDQSFDLDALRIVLVRLDPYPESGPIPASAYRVHLLPVTTSRTSSDPDSWGQLKGQFRN